MKNITNKKPKSHSPEKNDSRDPTPFADSKADCNLKISAELRKRVGDNKKQAIRKKVDPVSFIEKSQKLGFETICEETEDQLRRERAIPKYGPPVVRKIPDCLTYKPNEEKLSYRVQRAIEYGFLSVKTIDTLDPVIPKSFIKWKNKHCKSTKCGKSPICRSLLSRNEVYLYTKKKIQQI